MKLKFFINFIQVVKVKEVYKGLRVLLVLLVNQLKGVIQAHLAHLVNRDLRVRLENVGLPDLLGLKDFPDHKVYLDYLVLKENVVIMGLRVNRANRDQ